MSQFVPVAPAAPTVSAALAGALARHTAQGFARIARVNATLVTDLEQHGIGVTMVGHEVATIASADAFARATGTLAVAITTTGPGFTNALTALAETTRARVPLIVLAADAPTAGNRPWDVDQEMLAAALGVRTLTVTPDNIDAIVDRAVDSALRTRRPVVLSVAIDIIGAPASPTGSRGIDLSDPAVIRSLSAATLPSAAPTPAAIPHPPTGVNPVERTSAVQALTVAMRPVIIAGRGAWLSGAATELGLMADALGAITATTALARGIFPAQHFDLGVVGGLGQEAAMRLISEADAVLVVGASLNSFTTASGTLFGPHTTVVRVDVDDVPAPEADHEIVQHRLRGDASAVLRELRETLALSRPAPSGWRERVPGSSPAAHSACATPDSPSTPRASAPTGSSIRVPSPRASPSCFRPTGTWPPTADRRSPGPAVTGRWPRPLDPSWWVRRSEPSASAALPSPAWPPPPPSPRRCCRRAATRGCRRSTTSRPRSAPRNAA